MHGFGNDTASAPSQLAVVFPKTNVLGLACCGCPKELKGSEVPNAGGLG